MWKKCCDACKKKNVRCDRKATFHYKGKLQELFRAGLNEINTHYHTKIVFIFLLAHEYLTEKSYFQ